MKKEKFEIIVKRSDDNNDSREMIFKVEAESVLEVFRGAMNQYVEEGANSEIKNVGEKENVESLKSEIDIEKIIFDYLEPVVDPIDMQNVSPAIIHAGREIRKRLGLSYTPTDGEIYSNKVGEINGNTERNPGSYLFLLDDLTRVLNDILEIDRPRSELMGKTCNRIIYEVKKLKLSTKKEEKLHRMINFIDIELGRYYERKE